jgi:hypothetical protein
MEVKRKILKKEFPVKEDMESINSASYKADFKKSVNEKYPTKKFVGKVKKEPKIVQEFPFDDEINSYIDPVYTSLTKHGVSHLTINGIIVRNVKLFKFEFETSRKFGVYICKFLSEKGYIAINQFKNEKIDSEVKIISKRGKDLLLRKERGLIQKTEEEILAMPGSQIVQTSVVKYRNPSHWIVFFSLPLAQISFWLQPLIDHLSVDKIPELSDEEKELLNTQLYAVNKKLDAYNARHE